MSKRAKIFFFLFLTTPIYITSQTDSLNNLESVIQTMLSDIVTQDENINIYDLLEQYLENPIDLNYSTKNELLELPLLNVLQINDIIDYRDKYGKVHSYSELNILPNITQNTIILLRAFTYLDKPNIIDSSIWDNLNTNYRHRISKNIQLAEGYKSGYYHGSPYKFYNRLKADYNSTIQFGALIEKDPGEKSYFDFYSGFIKTNNLINGIDFIIGNYTFEFGQGLTMWSPYSFSKGSDATNSIVKNARGISPYTSAGEFLFLTGGAVQYSSKYFSLLSLYSSNDNEFFNYKQNSLGVSASIMPNDNIKVSILYHEKLDFIEKDVHNEKSKIKNSYLSIAYNLIYNNIIMNGEFVLNDRNIASINTFQLSFLRNLILVASVRNYPANYRSYYANGFGETNNTNNEFGLYFGLKWNTNIGLFNFYLDQYKFPKSTRTIPLPSNGNDLSISYSSSVFSYFDLFLRYFHETKEVLELVENENLILYKSTNKFRVEIAYKINRKIQFRTRVEIVRLEKHNQDENGILLFQDVKTKINNDLSLWGRILFFDTDSYNSRIYEFENDLVGVMTNLPLWGSGVKWYLMLKYNPIHSVTISAKYSELYKPKETFLGSGYNTIQGNIDNKLSLQIDYRF